MPQAQGTKAARSSQSLKTRWEEDAHRGPDWEVDPEDERDASGKREIHEHLEERCDRKRDDEQEEHQEQAPQPQDVESEISSPRLDQGANARAHQDRRQYYGYGMHRIAEEENRLLNQRDLDQHERQTDRGEVATEGSSACHFEPCATTESEGEEDRDERENSGLSQDHHQGRTHAVAAKLA